MDYSFDIEYAKTYGVDEAIVIKTLTFWLAKNKTDGRNVFEDRVWTFNTVDAWSAHFPFWTPKQMRRVLESLIEKGVLVTGTFNKRAMDRTLWYAFKDESIFLPGQINTPKWANESAQMGTALPVTTPITTPDKEPLTPKGEYPDLFDTKTTVGSSQAKASIQDQALDYINQKTGSRFTTHSRTGLTTLIKDGVTIDRIRAVIDRKVSDWSDDPKMKHYLRPSTLFAPSNFQNYENELRFPSSPRPVKEKDFHDMTPEEKRYAIDKAMGRVQ